MLRDQLEKKLNDLEKYQKKQELIKEKQKIKKQKYIINKAWIEGIKELKNKIKKGYRIATKEYNLEDDEITLIDKDLCDIISSKGIENGISVVVYLSKNRSYIKFLFSIEDYNDNYMLNIYNSFYEHNIFHYNPKNYNKREKIHQEILNFFQNEAEYYTDILTKGIDDALNGRNESDSLKTALYRLGYDVEPAYQKYLDYFHELEQEKVSTKLTIELIILYQEIVNCIEISHLLNKQKMEKNHKFKIRKR